MMIGETIHIHVEPNSELAHLLERMEEAPLVLEKDGKLYRVIQQDEDDIWAGYDPTKVKVALKKSAGALQGVDREELMADIHLARQ